MSISERIYQERKAHGFTQEQLADQLGVSRQAVSKWESGQSLPDLERAVQLADIFEITTDELLTGTEPVQEEQIENEKQVESAGGDARLYAYAGLGFIGIGTIVYIVMWTQMQTNWSYLAGALIQLAGSMVYGFGQSGNHSGKIRAKSMFWTAGIWMLLLIPAEIVCSVVFPGWPKIISLSAPLFHRSISLMVYAAVCLGLDLAIHFSLKSLQS